MTRHVLLIRHGQTDWNHQRRIQGQLNSQLDETGRKQAAECAAALSGRPIAALWSSDLDRAVETATIIGSVIGLEPTLDARLREFSLGDREGLTHAEWQAVAPDEFAAFMGGDLAGVRPLEPVAAVADRTSAAVGDLVDSLESGQTGLIISHGGAIRIAVETLVGGELPNRVPNCAGAQLTASRSGWRLVAYGESAAQLALRT